MDGARTRKAAIGKQSLPTKKSGLAKEKATQVAPDAETENTEEWRTVDLLGNAPLHLLRRSTQAFYRLWQERIPHLTPPQCAVLIGIRHARQISQARLSRMTGVDVATLTEMLNRLEKRGLLTRTADSEHSRRNVVRLTPAGEEELRKIKGPEKEMTTAIMGRLNKAERKTLLKLLHKLVD